MIRNILLATILFLFPATEYAEEISNNANEPIEFVVVIPSYNNEQWCIANLESVVNQTYPHFTICYINDCSTDKTGQLVDQYIKEKNLEGHLNVIHNGNRKGAMANLYMAISRLDPKKVVAVVDGDDRLAHNGVLELLAKTYADRNVWITHGNYTTEPFTKESYCEEYSKKTQSKLRFRKSKWMGCQLRTFYAKLFQLIEKEDLMWKSEFLPMTYDLAIMFPMLEMASFGHIRFISDPIYVVNTVNPISDRKKNVQLQRDLDKHLRTLPSYKPLKELF